MLLFLFALFFLPEAHVSTHIEEENLHMIVSGSRYILLVEELSTGKQTRKYKSRTYEIPEKKFKVIEVIKGDGKKFPETITVTSERERKDRELQLEYELTRLSKFPIYSMPDRNLWAKPDEVKKILFLTDESLHPWPWIYISESFKEKMKLLRPIGPAE
jgi:hypothetical protein